MPIGKYYGDRKREPYKDKKEQRSHLISITVREEEFDWVTKTTKKRKIKSKSDYVRSLIVRDMERSKGHI